MVAFQALQRLTEIAVQHVPGRCCLVSEVQRLHHLQRCGEVL